MTTKAKIETAIKKVAASEKTTKAGLSTLSRDLLVYVPKTQDIGMVNRLLSVLTPKNREVCALYFKHFLPWEFKEGEFGSKKKGDKTLAKYTEARDTWLSVPENDLWKWVADNIKPAEKKKPDFISNITRNVSKALQDKDNPHDAFEIMKAVMEGGITPNDLLKVMSEIRKQEVLAKEQAEQLEQLEEAA